MKRLYYYLFFIVSLCYVVPIYGQEKATEDWVLHSEADGVKAYYRISECDSESVVFLKFINENSYTVNVTWSEQISFEGSVDNPSINPMPINLFVEPGEIFGIDCNDIPILQLVCRPNLMPNEQGELIVNTSRIIKNYDFLNLKVEKK